MYIYNTLCVDLFAVRDLCVCVCVCVLLCSRRLVSLSGALVTRVSGPGARARSLSLYRLAIYLYMYIHEILF